ncbi:hypothetical protein [Blastococcus saxobsidens]|uniref:Uncharacterized protein n=1 Tax=Blastococcus saxobsidens TaxID=138336 RepID=A0A4Q7Y457_9ACTN|nr:hypothetical protein [Blastococcus saxobsidens]RZU31164.1 hypothetical protein BKA19_0812 [Blastococcus saxobsidens]
MSAHFLVGDDGEPLGVVDIDVIQARATVLGFELATFHDDPPEIDRVMAEALTELGPEAFGYVAAAALRHVVENVVNPLMDVADAAGVGDSVHAGLVAAARHAREVLS